MSPAPAGPAGRSALARLIASLALPTLLAACPTEVTTLVHLDAGDVLAEDATDTDDVRSPDDPLAPDADALDDPSPAADAPDIHDAEQEPDTPHTPDASPDAPPEDTPPDAPPPACPDDMSEVQSSFCIDRHEAPNLEGEPPLVMMSLIDARRWCEARGKRTCYDDEWTLACAGPTGTAYPYGATHQDGACQDGETWRVYTQSLLNGWPSSASSAEMDTLAEQLATARAAGPAGQAAANHVEALYQGALAGAHPGCGGAFGVYDLVGNVEEWTTRRDGGDGPDFTGALKGRYWAESRTCQSAVRNHGDGFRFYETGFRCCRDTGR